MNLTGKTRNINEMIYKWLIMQIFIIFRDGDGLICKRDLKLVMDSLGEKLTEIELNNMIDEFDIDNDGQLNEKGS